MAFEEEIGIAAGATDILDRIKHNHSPVRKFLAE